MKATELNTNPFEAARPWVVSLVDSEARRSSLVLPREVQQNRQGERQGKNGQRLPLIVDEARVKAAVGLETDAYGFGRCPLPGHHGSASIERDHVDRELAFECDCNGVPSRFPGDSSLSTFRRPLSDVFYAVRAGAVLDRDFKGLAAGYRLVWRMLLLVEVGQVVPHAVVLPANPPSADVVMDTARELFALLLGTRQALAAHLRHDPLPMPFSVTLVKDWCRLPSRARAHRTIQELIVAGIISPTSEPRWGPWEFVPGGAEPESRRAQPGLRGVT